MNNPRHPSILVVDNDPNVLAVLTARLGGMGYHCTTAQGGEEALSRFASMGADLVISDLNMPNGNGVEFARSLRERSDVPLILVSGFKDAYRKHLRGVANVSFLHKPFSSEELASLVQGMLLQHEWERRVAQRAAHGNPREGG